MKKLKDKKIIALIAILVIFTFAYFIVVNKISYAFDNKQDLEKIYNNRLEYIIKSAEIYGEKNLESFNEEGLMYINVQSLIDNGFLIPNEEGKIVNSLNVSEPMNDKKIRLKYENEKVTAEIYS